MIRVKKKGTDAHRKKVHRTKPPPPTWAVEALIGDEEQKAKNEEE